MRGDDVSRAVAREMEVPLSSEEVPRVSRT